MYLQLYDYDNGNAPVQINLGTCADYDIPDSGSYTDSRGRTWTINTHTDYGQYKITHFQLPNGSKLINFADYLATLREMVTSADPSGADIYDLYQTVGNGRLTPDEEATQTPTKPYIQYTNDYIWWYPEAGTASNYSNYHNLATPSETTMMLFATSGGNNDGGYCYGVCSCWTFAQNNGYSAIEIIRCINFNANTMGAPQREPGEEGFRPIGYHSDKTTGGGDHSNKIPEYKTDLLNPPGEPDESAASLVGSGFVNAYMVTSGNLASFGSCLFSSTLLTALANLFVNPLDAVISLNVFPCKPKIGTSTPIKLLNHVCSQGDLGIDANGFTLAKQFRTFDFGSITIAEEWESFLDYEGTNANIYLPFIGEIDLPITEIMGATINVQYTVDFFTGMCVATVTSTRNIQLSRVLTAQHRSIHSYTGNISINVPLSAVNYGNIVGSFISAASSGLRSGAAGALVSLASDAAGGGFKPSITTKGTVSANAGFCAILYPYIEIERPITAEPDGFQEVVGYPSYIKNTIGECKGLCVCDEIDLRGITGATENEIRRIRQLCREGVRN